MNNEQIETDPWEGEDMLNPVWDVYENIDVSIQRKNLTFIFIDVHDAYMGLNRFMGHCKIPVKQILKSPGVWIVNGFLNLTEKDEHLNRRTIEKGTVGTSKNQSVLESKISIGKIYVQMKWIPVGFKDNGQEAPIVEYHK